MSGWLQTWPYAQALLALSVAVTLHRAVGRIRESARGFSWHHPNAQERIIHTPTGREVGCDPPWE